MLEGSCGCGRIRYAVDGELGAVVNCHCRTCRKTHAAAFNTSSRIPRARFRWTQGESELAAFESTPGKKRFFCPRCGAHLMAAWDGSPDVVVRVGSLDSDPGARPRLHIWTSHKAPWHAIADALPQLAEAPAPGK
jgi:hypothetical protein